MEVAPSSSHADGKPPQSAGSNASDEHARRPDSGLSPMSTPKRPLSLESDQSQLQPPRLSPSPKFKEPLPGRRIQEDYSLIATPPRFVRQASSSNLSSHMPQRDHSGTPSNSAIAAAAAGDSAANTGAQEGRENYESPGSVLPRHSRGMDFSRARTHLHHSTIPDQSTPGSSPIVSSKAGIDIPSRRGSMFSGTHESPRTSFTSQWHNGQDRFFRPHSMGSATALTSDASASSSDEDDNFSRNGDEDMLATPQVNKEMNFNAVTPYGTREDFSHQSSPMQQRRFHPFRRTQGNRPIAKLGAWRGASDTHKGLDDSVEHGEADDIAMEGFANRRDSISTVTDKLAISKANGNESGDEGPFRFQSNTGVVRRPVTRRSNLLPKTKGFARIKAALLDESAPIDSESKREAAVIRQVRTSELGSLTRGSSNVSASSPDLTPTVPNMPMDASDMSDVEGLGLSQTTSSSSDPTKQQRPPYGRRNSGFRDLFPRLHTRMTTPPPLSFQRPRSSSGISGISEDMRLDSPTTHTPTSNDHVSTPGAGTDDASLFQLPNLPSAAEISKKVSKRRRDEDWDPASIKRRAVSPGMSVHSSPVLGQSPVSNSGGWWGRTARENSGSSAAEERHGSMSSGALPGGPPTPGLNGKRVGMQQGMFDTNDGFTKMTIE